MGHGGPGHVIPAGVKALLIWPLRAKGPRTALLRSRTVDHRYTSGGGVKEEKRDPRRARRENLLPIGARVAIKSARLLPPLPRKKEKETKLPVTREPPRGKKSRSTFHSETKIGTASSSTRPFTSALRSGILQAQRGSLVLFFFLYFEYACATNSSACVFPLN